MEQIKAIADVVDRESGEILTEILPGDKIKRKEQEEKAKEYLKEHIMNFNKGASFVKLYDDVLEKLGEELTDPEFKVAVRLAKHVSYEDCILRYNGTKKGKILEREDLCDILNMNYKTCSRIINSLIKKGVLGEHRTGSIEGDRKITKTFTCNPFIYTRGKNIEKGVVDYFYEKSGWLFPEIDNNQV